MIQMPFWTRCLIVLTISALLALPAYNYLATHDVERTARELVTGSERVTWPPSPKRLTEDPGEALVAATLGLLLGPARTAALALFAASALLTASRFVHRRRRARKLVTLELRLGRDDLSNPYRVQEAFEAIIGALSARWYERLWRGQDHLALETHRLPDRSIRFTSPSPPR